MPLVTRITALACLAGCCAIPSAAAPTDSNLAGRWLLSQWHRRVWQIEDGLPHNYVTALAYDSDRYLLVGTQKGTARFDGMRFTPFPALSDRWIYSLLRASDGTLWAGTYQNGLYRIRNGHAQQWGTSTGFTDRSVYSIVEDHWHRVWLASEGGLYRIEGNHVHAVVRDRNTNGYAWQPLAVDETGAVWFAGETGVFHSAPDALRPVRVRGIHSMPVTLYFWRPMGRLYLGTVKGLFILKCAGDQCQASPVRGLKAPIVGLTGVSDGSLWVASWGRGLFRVSGDRVESLSTKEGLADDFVRTIKEDTEHNVWVGTRGGGLTRFRATILKPVGMPEGLGGNCASAATGDGRDGVWLGTWRSGLFHWRSGHLQPQSLTKPALSVLITSLALDGMHRLWIGSMQGLWALPRFGANAEEISLPTPDAVVSSLLVTRNHELWIAQEGEGIAIFPSGDPRTSKPVRLLPNQNVTVLLEDRSGDIWIGAAQGLWVVHNDPGRPTEQVNSTLRRVTAIYQDSRGRVWVAAAGGQIQIYSGSVRHRFLYANLPAPEVYSILEDDRHRVWFGTGRGLANAPMKDVDYALNHAGAVVHFSSYGTAEGMRSIECRCARQPQSWKMEDGSLWVPTAKGFIQIDPSRPENLPPPKPVIEEIALDGRTISLEKTIVIPPGRHDFEARFTAIRLGLAEGVRFRYRMAGLDPGWVWAGSVRVARYGQLPPGNFQLMVAARDAGGAWSDIASVAVKQRPYFYQTIWFRVCGVLTILGLSFLLYRLRVRMVRQRYAAVIGERNRIAREFHDTLLAGLSAVSWQIDAAMELCAGEPAEPPLTTARGMLRYCRDEARRAVGDLRDEPEPEPPLDTALKRTIEQITAGTGTQPIFDIHKLPSVPAEMALDITRICQEAVSNAMRHGHATQIKICLRHQNGDLRLAVEDNGWGADQRNLTKPPPGHFGVLGMRERARRFGGNLSITTRAGSTLVEAAIPLAPPSPVDQHVG
jgi:signal transduction histidine kinase/ligand-binding sensor domain-containing protein